MTRKRSSRVDLAQPNRVLREVDYIVGRAAQFDSHVDNLDQLVFFRAPRVTHGCSTPRMAWPLQLAEAGAPWPAKIVETARYAIEWTASYSLDAFVTMDWARVKAILGYPVDELTLAGQRIARKNDP